MDKWRASIAGDVFWRAMTWMGDGITMSILIFLLLFIRFRTAFLAAAALITGSLAAQWAMVLHMTDLHWYCQEMDLHLVRGTIYAHFSFLGRPQLLFASTEYWLCAEGRPVLQWFLS